MVAIKPLLIIASLALAMGLAPVAADEDGSERAEMMLQIVEKAKERVNEIFYVLARQGIPIPKVAQEKLNKASAMVEEAAKMLEAGDVKSAERSALEAIKSIDKAARYLPQRAEEALEERARGIRQAIDKTYEFVKKVEALVNRAKGRGYDPAKVETALSQARSFLKDAKSLLKEGKVEEAAKMLGEARRSIANGLRSAVKAFEPERKQMAKKYVERAIERLSTLEERLSKLPVSEAVVKLVKDRIQRAIKNFEMARTSIEAGEERRAVALMKEVMKKLRRELTVVEKKYLTIKDVLAQSIRVFNAELDRLEKLVETLEERRIEVSTFKEMIKKARQLLDEVEANLDKMEPDDVQKVLFEVKELIEKLREGLREQLRKSIERPVARAG